MPEKDCEQCHGDGIYGNKDNECHECCWAGIKLKKIEVLAKRIEGLIVNCECHGGFCESYGCSTLKEILEKIRA